MDKPAAGGATLQTSPIRVSPSMMCADQLHLLDHVRQLEATGVHFFHMDIMDGHFAPNVSMAMPQLEQLRSETAVPFDVHLMVENNDAFVDLVAAVGVQQVAVHAESCTHLDRTLAHIRETGARAGVAMNPHTPIDVLRYVLDRLDFVLVMTVNPGFAGQKLVPGGLRKIADTRRLLDKHARDVPIEVDGNVSFEYIPAMVAAGADILVAGTSSLFHVGSSLDVNVKKLNEAVAQGYAQRSANSNRAAQ